MAGRVQGGGDDVGADFEGGVVRGGGGFEVAVFAADDGGVGEGGELVGGLVGVVRGGAGGAYEVFVPAGVVLVATTCQRWCGGAESGRTGGCSR